MTQGEGATPSADSVTGGSPPPKVLEIPDTILAWKNVIPALTFVKVSETNTWRCSGTLSRSGFTHPSQKVPACTACKLAWGWDRNRCDAASHFGTPACKRARASSTAAAERAEKSAEVGEGVEELIATALLFTGVSAGDMDVFLTCLEGQTIPTKRPKAQTMKNKFEPVLTGRALSHIVDKLKDTRYRSISLFYQVLVYTH